MCGVVEPQQSEAPDTCLKDLCSIHNRASMVHKRNLFYAFSAYTWNAVVFHNLSDSFCYFFGLYFMLDCFLS